MEVLQLPSLFQAFSRNNAFQFSGLVLGVPMACMKSVWVCMPRGVELKRTRVGLRSIASIQAAPSLPRFRGFAPEKSIFARMAPGKPLIIRGYMERMRPKTAVVKTYPVPAGRFRSLDSPRHVFTADPANEGRQDAQLLERRREPAS